MRLHTLSPKRGSRHRTKRLGCGESSGHGKTSGKGHKGQKARSGGSIRPGFEGGQMPLIRRLPKRGFNHAAFSKKYCPVNLKRLASLEISGVINEKALREVGLVQGRWHGVKILAEGEINKAINVEVHQVSSQARSKIEAAGGSITLLKKEKPLTPRVDQKKAKPSSSLVA